MKLSTANIIVKVEDIIGRMLKFSEEVKIIDSIEYDGIKSAKELVKMYDLMPIDNEN